MQISVKIGLIIDCSNRKAGQEIDALSH